MSNAQTNQNSLQIECEEKTLPKATLGKLIFDGYKKVYNLQERMKNKKLSS